ncbi:MAG: hypothetical protein ABI280_11605, partial [Ginsengibacter sp.]
IFNFLSKKSAQPKKYIASKIATRDNSTTLKSVLKSNNKIIIKENTPPVIHTFFVKFKLFFGE